ncbi:MAG: arylformamidase [Gemmatimonas sp.]|nr:arylformamidase [Gemmatimonas sp.]
MYDITRPLGPATPPWPGDPPPHFEWAARRSEGSPVNVSVMRISAHSGTHADAPYHVADSGARIGELPLEPFLGPALVVEVTGSSIDARSARSALDSSPRPMRLLFRTGAWTSPEAFPIDFAALEPEAADLLVEAGVRLVGTDAPSIDRFDSTELPAHHRLAAAGIVILENLLLEAIEADIYELIALPLRLIESDGSPIRAVLRRP